MSDFDVAAELVLLAEGPMSNDQYDPGGLTKFGISKRWHPGVDVANLTRDQALDIYRREYWGECEKMPWPWALAVFDCAVNQIGGSSAVALAQKACGVTQDMKVGPATLAAMTGPGWQKRLADFMAWRALRYATESDLPRYGHGLFWRLFKMHTAALRAA